jgi:hypothetical protein
LRNSFSFGKKLLKTEVILKAPRCIGHVTPLPFINDNLTRAEVEQALERGEIIEDYPIGHRPLPDCLVLAKLSQTQPIHAVIAVDKAKDRVFVITIYVPSTERWHNDWRTRE